MTEGSWSCPCPQGLPHLTCLQLGQGLINAQWSSRSLAEGSVRELTQFPLEVGHGKTSPPRRPQGGEMSLGDLWGGHWGWQER